MKKGIIAVVLAVVAAGSAGAQVEIDITRGVGRTPIAVPDFATAPGEEELGRELTEVIRYDLDFTGFFNIIGRERYPRSFTGFSRDATRIDFEGWQESGAEFLIYVYVYTEGDTIIAECRLFDILSGQQVVGRRFQARPEWRRSLAHQFSDEIVLFLTGNAGIATSQIAFSVRHSADVKEIYVADYDGANLRQVTRHEAVTILPQFSPDGNRIAYVSYKDRFPFLYIYDLQSGASRPLSREVGLNASPAWAPNGNELAIVLSKDGNAEIYRVNDDGSNRRRLTHNRILDTSPTFSPDGNQIAFVSDRQGAGQIFIMDANGNDARRVSFTGGQAVGPAWSPNGRFIAFVGSVRGRGTEIFVLDLEENNSRQLTDSPGLNEAPAWSADSRHIMFSSNRGGHAQLWSVNLETGEERRVPRIDHHVAEGPTWGPRRN